MKDLQRLVKLIDAYSPAANPLLNLQDESILETKLFNLLKQEEALTDESVAKELYGGERNSGTSFRMLKSRFRKKLYNHLHFLKVPDSLYHNISSALYTCTTQLAEARALVVFSDYKAALKLLEQVHAITVEYELTAQEVTVLEEMSELYTDLNEEADFEHCLALLDVAYQKLELERKAQVLFNRALFLFRKKISQREKHLHTFPDIIQELEFLWQQNASSAIFNRLHKLQIYYFEQMGQYDKIASAVKYAEELLEQGRVNRHWYGKKYYDYILVYALLQCRRYEEGLSLAKEKEQGIVRETHNWFAFRENYVLLALHNRHYALAGELIADAAQNSHFSKIIDTNKERWELLRRYYFFVASQDKVEHPALTTPFVEDLKLLPKDKSGFNLALLVLDVLEKLQDRQTDDLEVQAERVRKYIQKYLKGEKAERPRLFMRLLLLALTKPNAAEAREQGQKLLEKLNVTPLPGDAFTEVEIVPYEHLWELALQLVEQRQQMQ